MAATASAEAVGAAGEVAPASDLSNPQVTDKYRSAAKIVNGALTALITKVVKGATVLSLCEMGDALIETQCKAAYNKPDPRTGAKVDKGVAFPTCISVNECAGNFSPLKSSGAADSSAAAGGAGASSASHYIQDGSYVLKAGDAVKIDLGAHIDNFIAVAATTVIVGEEGAAPADVTGPQADVLAAAYIAAEAALRTIKVGNTNTQVTEVISKVADAFGVHPIQGVLSHEMRHGIIDASNVIALSASDPEHKVDEFTFAVNTVYSLDIIFSTGEGKTRELDARPTIFKIAPESSYQVKMKASKALYAEAGRRFNYLPFTARAFQDEKDKRKGSEALLGISECVKHGLMHPYPVLYEREGAALAQVKFTVLLLPGGALKVTGLSLPANVKSEKAVPEDITALLATEPFVTKAKKAATKE